MIRDGVSGPPGDVGRENYMSEGHMARDGGERFLL